MLDVGSGVMSDVGCRGSGRYVADAASIGEHGEQKNVNNVWEVPHLCAIVWDGGHVRNQQAKAARNLVKPKLTTLWAAGLSFGKVMNSPRRRVVCVACRRHGCRADAPRRLVQNHPSSFGRAPVSHTT